MSETPARYRVALRRTAIPAAPSAHEALFALHCTLQRMPAPEREYRFAPPRRWRFDFAWPAPRLALEIEGGTWSAGRHSRGAGYEQDCEKYNAAVLAGWRVLRVTGAMVADGRALDLVRRALAVAAQEVV